MKTTVHSILFTEACQLECRYCYLKKSESYKKKPPLSEKQILDRISEIDKAENPKEINSRLLITGGEPFLYLDLINKILDIYGNRFSYSFNTSGYLLTPEIIQRLSNYNVSFVLSVDGGKRITNYLRPLKTSKLRIGYFEQLLEIVPDLIYHFPQTAAKIIVSPRLVDTIFSSYLEMERIGFKQVKLELDFESRPENPLKQPWDNKATKMFDLQLAAINEHIVSNFEKGLGACQISDVCDIIEFLYDHKPFCADNLRCRVFDGRTLMSVQSPNPRYCMSTVFPNPKDAANEIDNQFIGFKCRRNPNCDKIEYCAFNNCPKNSLDNTGIFFSHSTLECIMTTAFYKAAINLLTYCNNELHDINQYNIFISNTLHLQHKRKEQ